MRLVSTVLLAASVIAACASPDPSPTQPIASPMAPRDSPALVSRSASPSPLASVTLADADDCPVTQTTSAPPEIGERLFGSVSAYGNDDLWAGGLGENGIYAVPADYPGPDGTIGIKIGWWRNVPGSVVISGRRLDAPAPPLSGKGSDGYGTLGFQASGVDFPSEGCWEVTGAIGESTLSFVMFLDAAETT